MKIIIIEDIGTVVKMPGRVKGVGITSHDYASQQKKRDKQIEMSSWSVSLLKLVQWLSIECKCEFDYV